MQYKYLLDIDGNQRTDMVLRSDGACVLTSGGFPETADFNAWLAGGNQPGAAVPTPLPPPSTISDRQFFQQLAVDGEITEAEALAAVATGTVPAALATVIEYLPGPDQFAANMFLQGATTFDRRHPMTLALAALMEWDGPMLDALWSNAAAL